MLSLPAIVYVLKDLKKLNQPLPTNLKPQSSNIKSIK